jgi:hypothetical protein
MQNVDDVTLDGTVRVALLDSSAYQWSADHAVLDDIEPAAIVALSKPLSGKDYTAGTFDADDARFEPFEGPICDALAVYIDADTPATSRLVAYIDSGVGGLPWEPDGGPAQVRWNERGIFAL